MAVVSDRTTIPLGSEAGRKQSIVIIPAQDGVPETPGILAFESSADTTGTRTRYFTWFDSNGVYRYHTAIPTNQDSDGSTITSGATTTLNNLGTTAINAALIPGTAAIDLGTDAAPFRTEHILTSIVLNQTTANYTLTWDNPAAARAISIPDPLATATIMLDTGATNVIAYTKGTSTIAMAANADLDIATGITVNIDAAVTVTGALNLGTALTTSTEAITLNQSLSTTDDVTFDALTVTSVTDGTATLTAGGLTGLAALTTTGAIAAGTTLAAGTTVTCKGIINTTTAIDTTAQLQVGADNVYLTLGASDDTDSRIYFNATSLCFYDSDTNTAYTLRQLATGTTLNPTVTGDLTILDGKLTWTDAAAEAAAVWTFAGTTTTDITVASSITTGSFLTVAANAATEGNIISLTANAVTTGTMLYLETSAATFSGYYLKCFDGAANDFSVGLYGATIIAGNAAGTAALTLTAGDIKVTSGFLDIDSGVANGGHNIATADTGSSAVPLITVTNSSTAYDQPLILLNGDATGAFDVMQITQDSTGYGLSVVGTAVTGKQAYFAGPAAQEASIVVIDGTTGAGWDGATGVGMLNLSGDGAHAHAAASLLNITDGTGAMIGSARGACLRIVDTTTNGADSFVGYISTTNNDGLLIDTGQAADINLKLSSTAAGSGQMLYVDGVTGTWVGANGVGQVEVTGDGVLAAGASMLRVYHATGAPTAASYLVDITGAGTWAGSTNGTCIRVTDSGAVAGTSSAVYINSTANNGLNVVTQAIAATNVILSGVQGQTASIMSVDGTTGTGWIGAATTGMVSLTADGPLVADASCLRIASSGQPAAANDGICLDIVETGTAQATSYAVKIDSTANEALHVATGKALFDETATFTKGLKTQVAVDDIHDTVPTNTNISATFGSAATAGTGFIGIINDAGGDANVWLVYSDGTSWFYCAKGTKAV